MSKDTYDEIDLLLADLKSDIEEVLMCEVFYEVRDIELSHIKRDVLSAHTPKIYKRRTSGGIDDAKNIVGNVKNLELVVDNVTEFSEGYGTYNSGVGLADLINEGSGKSGYYYDYPGSFERPRPFIDNTIAEIENTDTVENVLERGLKKRKYDVS